MYSAKTSTILNYIERYNLTNTNTLVVKYTHDTRYSTDDEIITHNKRSYSKSNGLIVSAHDLANLDDYIFNNNIQVVGIDEFQFYQNPEYVLKWANSGINVYLSALDGDYKQVIFSNVSHIIPYCNTIKKLKSVCQDCKSFDGIYTYRTSNDINRVVIGGKESYMSLCRACHINKMMAID